MAEEEQSQAEEDAIGCYSYQALSCGEYISYSLAGGGNIFPNQKSVFLCSYYLQLAQEEQHQAEEEVIDADTLVPHLVPNISWWGRKYISRSDFIFLVNAKFAHTRKNGKQLTKYCVDLAQFNYLCNFFLSASLFFSCAKMMRSVQFQRVTYCVCQVCLVYSWTRGGGCILKLSGTEQISLCFLNVKIAWQKNLPSNFLKRAGVSALGRVHLGCCEFDKIGGCMQESQVSLKNKSFPSLGTLFPILQSWVHFNLSLIESVGVCKNQKSR